MNIRNLLFCLLIILGIMLISPVYATTTCLKSLIDLNELKMQDSMVCLNEGNNTVSLMSSLSWVFIYPSYIEPGDNPTITIIASSSTPHGYDGNGAITFSDGTSQIPLSLSIAEENIDPSEISFPSSKNFNVKQGDEYNKEIKLIMPSDYLNPITIQTIDFSDESSILRFGDKEEGITINPGDVFSIPLVIDATEAEAGQYPSVDVIIRYDDGGIKTIKSTITIYVSATVNPIGSETFSTPPTCSLTSTTFNLNNTYSFTCSNTVANLEIVIPSSNYYIGKKVETSQNLYRYDFMPTKYGETTFKAEFRYKGASIFEPFEQDVRITSAGSITPGTSLRFVFTPSLDVLQEDQLVLIQLVDNKTGSLVSDPRIWVNAKELNSSGGESFETSFKVGSEFELRGKSSGYDDLVQSISINPKFLEIIVNPTVGDTSTLFNISTDIDGASLSIKGVNVNNPFYGSLSPGENVIEASKDGYQTKSINITVKDYIRIIDGGFNFKKGEPQNFTLSRNVTSWIVYYQKKLDSVERETLLTGSGNNIAFTPKKSGVYFVEADGFNIASYQAEGFSFTEKWWIFPIWGWIIIFVMVLAIVIFIFYLKGESSPKGPDVSEGGWEV